MKVKREKILTPFSAALDYFLVSQGHGANKDCANAVGISTGYVTDLRYGAKEGLEDKRRSIAAYFDLEYESMLHFGEAIIDNKGNPDWVPPPQITMQGVGTLKAKGGSHAQNAGTFIQNSEGNMLNTNQCIEIRNSTEQFFWDEFRAKGSSEVFLKKCISDLIDFEASDSD